MSDLIFMMGNFEVRIPTDRFYCDYHMWLKNEGDVYKVGFTSFSVRLLKDVYFLDWQIDPLTEVAKKKEIGEVESSKALSTLYAPYNGKIVEFNELLMDDPSLINSGNYDKGWLFTLETDETLMKPEEYIQFLEDKWDETERHLKGQMN